MRAARPAATRDVTSTWCRHIVPALGRQPVCGARESSCVPAALLLICGKYLCAAGAGGPKVQVPCADEGCVGFGTVASTTLSRRVIVVRVQGGWSKNLTVLSGAVGAEISC